MILGGVRIGAGALVGAGAVVTRDMARPVVIGNPPGASATAGIRPVVRPPAVARSAHGREGAAARASGLAPPRPSPARRLQWRHARQRSSRGSGSVFANRALYCSPPRRRWYSRMPSPSASRTAWLMRMNPSGYLAKARVPAALIGRLGATEAKPVERRDRPPTDLEQPEAKPAPLESACCKLAVEAGRPQERRSAPPQRRRCSAKRVSRSRRGARVRGEPERHRPHLGQPARESGGPAGGS